MLLIFEDAQKEHLSFLTNLDADVLREFGRISLNFIKKGANTKIFQGAAQKLKVSVETIQHGVEGLMYLLIESSKHMLNDIDFQDSIMALGFTEDTRSTLLEIYLENRKEIRDVLDEMSLDLPHYHNLEWRLDVQLASRSLRHQVTPTILLKLQTEDGGKKVSHMLQTDPVNMVHMARVLEEALQEMKSSYCRRIARNIK
ncbi:COMM domain-containing protein 2 [Biomphalaria glabrata]|uniref:COMM domain-containing protein 2-like n=1 Tax=Biomphalaria glabrata TaxID=6526 RepID=A0A9U8E301_BIOGL|nr:COMM domain-containing protein 2-like [Biomphalaria glabrata]KAI8751464.1 COMM domain-containing protein 2-like [Biomphalaria glabrata]KAI8770547.1 COMM domain-containing protein 2 [Biomphalaria glabrata]